MSLVTEGVEHDQPDSIQLGHSGVLQEPSNALWREREKAQDLKQSREARSQEDTLFPIPQKFSVTV